MNPVEQIQEALQDVVTRRYADQAVSVMFSINTDEKKQQFGDLSSNVAMILAKKLGRNPREVAQEIIDQVSHPIIARMSIAGPGFLNIFLAPAGFGAVLCQLFEDPAQFFRGQSDREKASVSLEFISANPTGPLHFGHGRGGIIGDVLGNVLAFLTHPVTKEFYSNDAGAQIKKLGISLKVRCEQQLGMASTLPEDAYHGEYLAQIASGLITEYGKEVLDEEDSFFEDFAKTKLLNQIQGTLEHYGIRFNVWFSELELHPDAINEALKELDEKGFLYEKEGALWFRSTEFGDDKDRVVKKASGQLTYVAADIAYLKNKVARGHSRLIMILGHDHHSYVTRLQAVLRALGLQAKLEIILYQLVKIKASGAMVRMSKRAGTIVNLQDVIDTVGPDVARFFYLNRKADAQLEFDLDLALKHTDENPVYYIQYAYVRTGSILARAAEHPELQEVACADAAYLTDAERLLIKKLAALKEILATIEETNQVHLLAYYTHELAQLFSRYYSKNKVIDLDHVARSRARLLLVRALRMTLALCLDLMGISKPERM